MSFFCAVACVPSANPLWSGIEPAYRSGTGQAISFATDSIPTRLADSMSRVMRRLIPLGAGAWIALLAGGLIAPASAEAGCVHYVISMGRFEAERLAVNDLEIFSESRLRGDLAPMRVPTHRPLPCSGLSCSSSP